MTTYQITFVYPFSSISVSANSINEDIALDAAKKIIFAELGLVMPNNVSVEIEEIN